MNNCSILACPSLTCVQYMVILGLCGVTLLIVSIAALAFPKEQQKQLFQKAWKTLALKQKMDIQDSLNCCGLDTANRKVVQNSTDASDCQLGHPTCNTPILRQVMLYVCTALHPTSLLSPSSLCFYPLFFNIFLLSPLSLP